jgi:FkbM family methyltransferase
MKFNGGLEDMSKLIRKLDWFINGKVLKRKSIKRKLKFFSMYLDTQTDGISRALGINGSREDDMIFLIQKYLKKGATVIDCGSNIGFYPILESQIVGKSGKLVCIEPDPRNYELLKKNVALIDPGIKVWDFNIAVSSRKGSMNLLVAFASNLNRIVKNDGNVAKGDVIEVDVNTVDWLVEELDIKPDFLRMDVEGGEVDVIKGMRKTLENAQPGFVLLFELHPEEYNENNSLSEELHILRDCGFRCEAIVSSHVPLPDMYKSLGYSPDMTIKSDGRMRGVYYGVSYDDAIALATAVPKVSRYILLVKGKTSVS